MFGQQFNKTTKQQNRFFHVAGHNCSKRQYDTKKQKDYHLVINTFINNYIYYILYYNIIYNIYNLR